jgi:hypothetical protein
MTIFVIQSSSKYVISKNELSILSLLIQNFGIVLINRLASENDGFHQLRNIKVI